MCEALRLADVGVRFGDRCLFEGVSITIRPAEVVKIVGPSGCGKTSLLRAVARQILFDGRIVVLGDDVTPATDGMPPHGLALVTQAPNLWDHLTVLQNVALVGTLCTGRSLRASCNDAIALLDSLEVANVAHRFPHSLSGGEQQRVALARGLIAEPALLLLDEVTSSVDFARRALIANMIRRETANGTAIVLVTHDIYTARDLPGQNLELTRTGLVRVDLLEAARA